MKLIAVLISIFPLLAEVPANIHEQTIYITPIGDNDTGRLIREKLVSELAPHFMILEAGDQADLILTGSNITNVIQQGGLTRYRITAMARLLDRDSHVLWSTTVTNAVLARSATGDVAKKITAALESSSKR